MANLSLDILLSLLLVLHVARAQGPNTMTQECRCLCAGHSVQTVCEHIDDMKLEVDVNTAELKKWAQLFPFVEHLRDHWKEEIVSIVETEMKKYVVAGELHPKSENLVLRTLDMQNDSNMASKHSETEEELAKNVTSLLAKMELVENRTMEVEEELKSERRVRRHLEEDLKETQSSLEFLGDQLQNATMPVDAIMNHVQMVIISSLEDMNKTIYEDHLRKLYYKVDGVVYKNEIRNLDERLSHVETELHDGGNSSLVAKLADDVKLLAENLYHLNTTIRYEDSSLEIKLAEDVKLLAENLNYLNTTIMDENSTLVVKLAEDVKLLAENFHDLNTTIRDENLSLVVKLAEDVKLLAENLHALNNTIENDLGPRLLVLDTIENVTTELEGKVEDILNSTEQFKTGLVDIWTDLQDFRSFQNEIHNFTEEWNRSLQRLSADLEDLKNKTLDDIIHVNWNFQENGTQSVSHTNSTMDNSVIFGNLLSNFTGIGGFVTDQGFNETEATEESLVDVTIEDYQPQPHLNKSFKSLVDYDDLDFNETILEVDATTEASDSLDARSDQSLCRPPVIEDLELLAVMEALDPGGVQTLTFGCRSIGKYAIMNAPVPVRCDNGTWNGPFPTCLKLADETKIQEMAGQLQENHPCLGKSGEFPDPGDCSRFFKCSHGSITVVSCPTNLHFNPLLRICDYPDLTGCSPVKDNLLEELRDLVPPISISPNNLDKANSLLGTGTSGELVVHPRSSFTLHCLYPESDWGMPSWNVTSGQSERLLDRTPERGLNRISLAVTAAREEDSGTFTCVTPFGVEHAIRVAVKAVYCPPILLDEEFEEVFYRPTPEGEQRILSSTAEFQCADGNRVIVVCKADGSWSGGVPDPEKCPLKKRGDPARSPCGPLERSNDPHLVYEWDQAERTVSFSCAGRKRLIGVSFTRCRDDGVWSHRALPRCIG